MSEKKHDRLIDAINPTVVRLSRAHREERLSVCRSCKEFTSVSTCSICKCFMPLKVGLPDASCPLGKWLQK